MCAERVVGRVGDGRRRAAQEWSHGARRAGQGGRPGGLGRRPGRGRSRRPDRRGTPPPRRGGAQRGPRPRSTLRRTTGAVRSGLGAQRPPLATPGTLRARYGITRQVQLGLTYQFGGFYAEEDFLASATGDSKFHPGKAVGLDVTVQLQKWLAVRVGVPVYVDPVAVGITLGAPLRFVFGSKLTLGGMEELLNIKASKFVPSFQYEYINAVGADNEDNNTTQSSGYVRPSGYAIYQYQPNLALIGRFGVQIDFDGGDTASTVSFMRAGLQFSPRRQIDLGFSLGFDDLSRGGSFSPAAYVSVRI